MRACGVRSMGAAIEVLEVADPREPGPGEVLVTLEVAGVGAWDPLVSTGEWEVALRPPAALGMEGSGTIVAVGEGVVGFEVGDPVLAHTAPLPGGSGFWAERVLVWAAHVARRPAGLDAARAAGLPICGLTARQVLDELRVERGQRLLVAGASGPTGGLAVQLAAQAGAEVVATASGRHAERLRRLGASDVVDSHVDGWAEPLAGQVDAALVAVAGTAAAALSVVREGGRLCSITSDAPPSQRGIRSTDYYVLPDGAMLAELAGLLAIGSLELDVCTEPLDDGPAVVDRVAGGRSGGRKFVLGS
jgi:NADPH:quinone reductase-like Zn-dependent oxidoreductase